MPTPFEVQFHKVRLQTHRRLSEAARNLRAQELRAEQERQERAKASECGSDGLSPHMRMQLVNIQKRQLQDPRSRALAERAVATAGVAEIRRSKGFDSLKPAPGFEFGRPLETAAPAQTAADVIAQRRAAGTLAQPAEPPKEHAVLVDSESDRGAFKGRQKGRR